MLGLILTLLTGTLSVNALSSGKGKAAIDAAEISSPYRASELALRNYIYYLSEEHVLKPTLVGISTDINGFAKSGDKVWEVRIVSEKKGLRALYFVNPKTGDVHMVCKPGQWQDNQCVESTNSE